MPTHLSSSSKRSQNIIRQKQNYEHLEEINSGNTYVGAEEWSRRILAPLMGFQMVSECVSAQPDQPATRKNKESEHW